MSETWQDVETNSPPTGVKLLLAYIYRRGEGDSATKVTIGRTADGIHFEPATDTPAVGKPHAGKRHSPELQPPWPVPSVRVCRGTYSCVFSL